ncbi:MAG: hypothetical protein ACM3OO_01260 [Planctomycetaceae bacterium]
MPAPDPSFGWQEGVAAYLSVVIAAFLVTWVVTDLLRVRRTAYVAILTVVVLALGGGYLAWSGTSLSELVTSNIGWGVVAGVAAAAIVTPLIARLPRHTGPTGVKRAELVVWEDVVYGTAEALLLATYPVLAIWQAAAAAGWTDGGWAKVGSGVLAVAGSLLVILVHHLGYAEFRERAARPALFGALVACGLQAIAFLVTGNVLAPVVAHIVLHVQLTFRGEEMPPARRAAGALTPA